MSSTGGSHRVPHSYSVPKGNGGKVVMEFVDKVYDQAPGFQVSKLTNWVKHLKHQPIFVTSHMFYPSSGYFWRGVVLHVRRCLHPGLVPRRLPCIKIHHPQVQRLISLSPSTFIWSENRSHNFYIVRIYPWNSSCWWYVFNWINDESSSMREFKSVYM